MSESNPATHRVRVGVVLPEDRATRICCDLPGAGYSITATGHETCINAHRPTQLVAHIDGPTIAVQSNGALVGRSDTWSIAPAVERERTGLLCRDCVAGRGFHWSTQIDVVLPGTVELSVTDGHFLVVNELDIETYLEGVITAEMSGDAPIEFLKAQCVVARSWMTAATEHKHAALGIDFCNDDCCQRFQGVGVVTPSARRAVDETAGLVLVHESGVVVDANYAKSCGGIVEAPANIWTINKPGQRSLVDAPDASPMRRFDPVRNENIGEYARGSWLSACDAYCSPQVVPESDLPRYLGRVDDGGGHFRWQVTYEASAFEDILRRKLFMPSAGGFRRFHDLAVTRRGRSGRATRIEIAYDDAGGLRRVRTVEDQHRIRDALHESFLYSSAFEARVHRTDGGRPTRIDLHGAGWGHGAGMCQIGALGMALRGVDHERILHHYFENVTIKQR